MVDTRTGSYMRRAGQVCRMLTQLLDPRLLLLLGGATTAGLCSLPYSRKSHSPMRCLLSYAQKHRCGFHGVCERLMTFSSGPHLLHYVSWDRLKTCDPFLESPS